MILLDSRHCDAIADILGDSPFTVTSYFFLRRRGCDVYADDAEKPQSIVIVPHVRNADTYVHVLSALGAKDEERLADFLCHLSLQGGLFVPAELIQLVRARQRIFLEAEGLCFTYRQIPRDFQVSRLRMACRLSGADVQAVCSLPDEAGFLYRNYRVPHALLTEGLAFGVFQGDHLVSVAASLACTPKHCDVGVYTLRRYRNRGYATDCVEALFAEAFTRGMRPLWRIGIRQKLAIYFAEKLCMDEIGTTGREVYLQTFPAR